MTFLFESSKVKYAIEFFSAAHSTQTRNNGKPYFDAHLLPVANFVYDNYDSLFPWYSVDEWNDEKEDVYIAALGHDYLEDDKHTKGTVDKLIQAGFSTTSIDLIVILTKQDGENYFDFIRRILNPPLSDSRKYIEAAVAIKLADTWHNGTDNPTEGSRQDKYRFAQWVLSKHLRSDGDGKLKFPLF